MVGAHVGHDSRVGDDNVIANHCLIGGHVQIGNGNFLGAGVIINEDDVRKKLEKLNVNKSPGPDQLHPRVRKELSLILFRPLSYIMP